MRTRAAFLIVALVLLAAGLWEVASRAAWVDPTLLPPLSVVLETLLRLLGDPAFQADLGSTSLAVLVAFAIAAPLGLASGFFVGERLHLGRVVNPIFLFALAVPQSVFLPIFILVFGIGFLAKTVFGITHAYFVIAITTVAAVRSISPDLVLAARAFGASPGQIYRRIYLPAMLPLILTGLRLGMVLNIIGVLLVEMYASRRGLGGILLTWGERSEIQPLLAGILLVSVLTILLNELLRLAELRAGRWRGSLAEA